MSFTERLKSVSLIFACGTALFSDGYANNVIGSVNTLLTRIYGAEVLSQHNHSRTVTSLTFAGTILGMLSFGYLSDKVGRKFGMMLAAGIVAFFMALSAASSGVHGSVGGLFSMLSACRFLLGIGVGAEYPCGSVAASEQTEGENISKNAQHRWLALATNTMITSGFVAGTFVPLVLFWIFGPNHLNAVWRGSLLFGAVPATAIFIWRLRMEEPPMYRKNAMKRSHIPYRLVFRRYWVSLAALSMIWFLYDFIVYVVMFSIFSSTVINNITGGSDDLTVIFGWNVVISLFTMPGTIFGAFIMDYLGAKKTMILGLVLQVLTGFLMSGLYVPLTNHIAAFSLMYGLFQTFGALGPGNCTLVLASKTSATAVRGQFFGVAAAVGKLGAFVGTWAFPPMIQAFGGANTVRGNTGPFWVASGLEALSAIITLFFVTPLTRDGMVAEDIAFREYLEANGYDTSTMGLGDEAAEETVIEVESEKNVELVSSEKESYSA